MILEIELGVIVLAGMAVVAAAVPVLLRVRRMSKEVEHLQRQMNERLPMLLSLTRETIQTANAAALDVRQGIAGARKLGDAVGQIATDIKQIQLSILHGTDTAARNVRFRMQGWIDGFRAAWRVVKNREITASRAHGLPGTTAPSYNMSKSGSGSPSRLAGSRGERRL